MGLLGICLLASTALACDESCSAALSDAETSEGDLSLLQRAAAEVHLESNISVESNISLEAASRSFGEDRWGNLFSARRRRSIEDRESSKCDKGAFVRYKDIKVEEGLEFKFEIADMGDDGSCAETTEYGPNGCCFKFGSTISVEGSGTLPQSLDSSAEMTAHASGWYGWIPISDSFSCKACGEDCRACPTISRYLPSLFPCKPIPMPPCPISAGSISNSSKVKLPANVRSKLKGSSATITWNLKQSGTEITSGQMFVKGT